MHKGYFDILVSKGQVGCCCLGHILHIPLWYGCKDISICIYDCWGLNIRRCVWKKVGASVGLNVGIVDVWVFTTTCWEHLGSLLHWRWCVGGG